MGCSFLMMWDPCGISENITLKDTGFPSVNVGFLKKVNFRFTFWYRNLNMPNLCIGWLVGEVDGAAAASLLRLIVFNLLFFR